MRKRGGLRVRIQDFGMCFDEPSRFFLVGRDLICARLNGRDEAQGLDMLYDGLLKLAEKLA